MWYSAYAQWMLKDSGSVMQILQNGNLSWNRTQPSNELIICLGCGLITWPSGASHRMIHSDFHSHYTVKMTFSNITCPESTIWVWLEGQNGEKKSNVFFFFFFNIICISLDKAWGCRSVGAEILITAFWSFHLSSHLVQMTAAEADVRLFRDPRQRRIDSFFPHQLENVSVQLFGHNRYRDIKAL